MKGLRALSILKIVFAAVFLCAAFVAIEFALPLLQSLIPEMTDGIPAPGTLMQFFFGEDGWTRAGYFHVVKTSVYTSFLSLSGYCIFSLIDRRR